MSRRGERPRKSESAREKCVPGEHGESLEKWRSYKIAHEINSGTRSSQCSNQWNDCIINRAHGIRLSGRERCPHVTQPARPRCPNVGQTTREVALRSRGGARSRRCDIERRVISARLYRPGAGLFSSAAEAGPSDILKMYTPQGALVNISNRLESNRPDAPYRLELVAAHYTNGTCARFFSLSFIALSRPDVASLDFDESPRRGVHRRSKCNRATQSRSVVH